MSLNTHSTEGKKTCGIVACDYYKSTSPVTSTVMVIESAMKRFSQEVNPGQEDQAQPQWVKTSCLCSKSGPEITHGGSLVGGEVI